MRVPHVVHTRVAFTGISWRYPSRNLREAFTCDRWACPDSARYLARIGLPCTCLCYATHTRRLLCHVVRRRGATSPCRCPRVLQCSCGAVATVRIVILILGEGRMPSLIPTRSGVSVSRHPIGMHICSVVKLPDPKRLGVRGWVLSVNLSNVLPAVTLVVSS